MGAEFNSYVDVAKNNTNKCIEILDQLKEIVEEDNVTTTARQLIWSKEIKQIKEKGLPNTTIGVLGNTGVGKSSLLNALLNEASILPTSGSRGCTAAVVELKYNDSIAKLEINEQAYVY